MEIKDKTVLLFSDSPHATTGRGRLTRSMIQMLRSMGVGKIIVAGPHHDIFKMNQFTGEFLPLVDEKWKDVTILDTRSFNVNSYDQAVVLVHTLTHAKVDLLITCCDHTVIRTHLSEIMKQKAAKGFKWLHYVTHDYHKVSTYDAADMWMPDKVIFASQHGVDDYALTEPDLLAKNQIMKIWHPVDASEFPRIDAKELAEFKSKYYTLVDSKTNQRVDVSKNAKPIIGWVGRSFWRKLPWVAIDIFAEFKKRRERGLLYIHGKKRTIGGLDLAAYAAFYGINDGSFITPNLVEEVDGISNEHMAHVYQTFDIYFSTSLGEGFGYPIVEAMLMGIPIVGPKNTSFPELVQDYGVLVDCDDVYTADEANQLPRPMISKKKAVDALLEVTKNLNSYKEKMQSGSEWVKKNLSLEQIGKEWQQVISEI